MADATKKIPERAKNVRMDARKALCDSVVDREKASSSSDRRTILRCCNGSDVTVKLIKSHVFASRGCKRQEVVKEVFPGEHRCTLLQKTNGTLLVVPNFYVNQECFRFQIGGNEDIVDCWCYMGWEGHTAGKYAPHVGLRSERGRRLPVDGALCKLFWNTKGRQSSFSVGLKTVSRTVGAYQVEAEVEKLCPNLVLFKISFSPKPAPTRTEPIQEVDRAFRRRLEDLRGVGEN